MVYEVEWDQLCNKVSKSSKTMSSRLLNSNTKLVLKVIFLRKNLKQLYGTLYLDNRVIINNMFITRREFFYIVKTLFGIISRLR